MNPRKNQLELARKLGVSVSTVSRALSDAPGISDELRKQIRKLAIEVGYRPRGSRTGTASAPQRIAAFVTLDRVTGGLASFYDGIVDGVAREARRSSLLVDVKLIDERTLDLALVTQDAAERPRRGIFFIGIDPPREVSEALLKDRVPTVLVNGVDPLMRYDSVAPANFYGAFEAAQLLLNAGHRSLLYVTSKLRWTTRQRLRGFCAGVAEVPGASVEVCELSAPTREEAEKAVDRLVANNRAWTAVFCMNDLYAIGVIQALQARGLRVPDDVSVLGFDDLPFAGLMSPRLSTMRVDREAIGRQAVELMKRRIADPAATPVHVDVGVVAVTGSTVGRLDGAS